MLDYDKLAAEYARHRQLHPQVLRSLLARSGIDATSKILEVGCGTGNYVIALQEAAGCTARGIDPSAEMLAKASGRGAPVILARGRAEELAFSDGFFDLVFSVDVIHHVGDRPAYFREARRILKPGGRICTVTDSEWIIRHRQPLSAYFPPRSRRSCAATRPWTGCGRRWGRRGLRKSRKSKLNCRIN